MFERFTEKARRVIFFARYEASHYGSPRIETEHLLLGLLREHKGITLLLPKADVESIRKRIDAATDMRETISTSVDMPLSNQVSHVLKYASQEADQMNHRYIGTEHLLLGLLREKDCFAAQILNERGADLAELRARIGKQVPFEPNAFAIPPSARAGETISIHDVQRNSLSIREAVKRCREYSWHWQKRDLTARDIVVNRRTGAISFELSLAAEDPATFEVIKGGWKKKDRCAVCRWELFESKEDATHGTGYTNGREWLCCECYDKFWQQPDFISGSYSDIT
jgi:Clp amino terminal domain, pathogenicity island component